MTVTKKDSAKERKRLDRELNDQKRKRKERNRLLNKPKLTRITRKNFRAFSAASKSRRIRILNSIGYFRQLPAKIIVNRRAAVQNDAVRLHDIAILHKDGRAAVYWTDGSHRQGFLGAGVVWRTKIADDSLDWEWHETAYKLGSQTGNSADAEVYAIAAALGLAREELQKGRSLELVRVYTDADGILTTLTRGNCAFLGPILGPKPVIQGLFEHVEWLSSQGVPVELIWVKGHLVSDGNVRADKAAEWAVRQQTDALLADASFESGALKTTLDVPKFAQELGQDWEDEWLWRANKDLYTYSDEERDDSSRPIRMLEHAVEIQRAHNVHGSRFEDPIEIEDDTPESDDQKPGSAENPILLDD